MNGQKPIPRPPRRKQRFAKRFPLSGPAIAVITSVLSVALIFIFGNQRAKPPDADAVFAAVSGTPLSTESDLPPNTPTIPPSSLPTAETSQSSEIALFSSLPHMADSSPAPLSADPFTASNGFVYVTDSEYYSIPQDLTLNSQYVYLIHVPTGGILLDRGSTDEIFPASMTKVMTALVVMDLLESRDEPILIGEDMFPLIEEEELAVAGFAADDIVSAEDLLYGLLLRSGAECAIALAEHFSGSESAFASLMNAKAAELGMTDTHFTNTIGYHSDSHYTTLRDMSVMFRHAMTKPWYYLISSARSHTSKPTASQPNGVTIQNTLFRYAESFDPSVHILAGKTGTTNNAGRCLVSEAIVNGQTFLCVTAAARGGTQPHIQDAVSVYGAITAHDIES